MRYREGPPERAPPGANVTGDACPRSGRAGAGERPQTGRLGATQTESGAHGLGARASDPDGLANSPEDTEEPDRLELLDAAISGVRPARVVARSAPKWALLPLHLPLLLPGSGHSQRPRPPAHGKVLGTRRKQASKRQPPSGLCLHFLLHQMTRCCRRRRRYLFLCALRPSRRRCWLAFRGDRELVGGDRGACLGKTKGGRGVARTKVSAKRRSGAANDPGTRALGPGRPLGRGAPCQPPHWVLAFPGDTSSSLGTPGGEGGRDRQRALLALPSSPTPLARAHKGNRRGSCCRRCYRRLDSFGDPRVLARD